MPIIMYSEDEKFKLFMFIFLYAPDIKDNFMIFNGFIICWARREE